MKEKIKIYSYKKEIARLKEEIEKSKKGIQSIVDYWNKLEIPGKPLSIAQIEAIAQREYAFNSIFYTPKNDEIEEMIKERIKADIYQQSQGIKSPHIDLNKMITLPNLEPLFDLFVNLPDTKDGIYWNFFTIEKNKVTVIDEKVKAEIDKYNSYIENETEFSRFEDVSKICDILNRLHKENPSNKPEQLPINVRLIKFENNNFVPAPEFIKSGIIGNNYVSTRIPPVKNKVESNPIQETKRDWSDIL